MLEDLFRRALPDFPHRPRSRRWEIEPEAERPELLGGCCQTNANRSQLADDDEVSGHAQPTPLGKSGGAVSLKVVSAVEVAFLVTLLVLQSAQLAFAVTFLPRE